MPVRHRRRITSKKADRFHGLRAIPTEFLTGTYREEDVQALGTDDGRAQFFTDVWGAGNREPRVVHALNLGAGVSTSLVSHDLHGSLPEIEEELELLAAQAPSSQDAVLSAIGAVEVAEDERAAAQNTSRHAELSFPEHHWRRTCAEMLGLALLGLGDVYFTSTTFEVFGLSDRNFGFLPFNELQLVASSTVVAMLLLTRLAGHAFRQVGHLLEEIRSDDDGKEAHGPRQKRLVVRSWFSAGHAALGVLGAGAVLVGLSQVRASYLAQLHIAAHQSQFLLIQLGIGTAGLMLSFWMAHPLDREWRATHRHEASARHTFGRLYADHVEVVGRFNGLLRLRDALFAQHRDWSTATVFDAERKGQAYARWVQLGQLEPTQEDLFPNALPVPAPPALVDDVNTHLAGLPTTFKAYEPLSLAPVTERLYALNEHRRRRHVESPGDPPQRKGATRTDAKAGAGSSSNGKRP